jgi:sterol desaturase/sphingolipid hydroxylase (fatty acid hydroxylase superfamily)
LIVETTAYYAFGIPIYVALVAAEAWRMRRRGRRGPSFAASFGNVGAGLGAIAVGLVLGPALLALYGWAYQRFSLVHFRDGSPALWAIALVGADFGHYWHHRLDHRVAACWAIHGVHHQPEEMNFTVAMRHAWFSDLYSFPFYAPLPLCGVPPAHFFVATTLLSVHALITHSAEYDFPSFGILVTPRSHILHHAKNPRYLDRNFGAMLRIWDRLFGTHVEPDPADPPVYGTLRGYETHDGARSQWVLVRDLLALARGARTLRGRLRVLFGRPGTAPPGFALPGVAPPRASAKIPIVTKVCVSALFLATAAASLWVFLLRDRRSLSENALGALAIVAALLALGRLVDGSPGSRRATDRIFGAP